MFSFAAKCLLQRLIDMSGYDSSILVPDQLNELSVITMFQKLAEEMYASFKGTLKCGNLESKIVLSPAPVVSVFTCLNMNILNLYGFIPLRRLLGVY